MADEDNMEMRAMLARWEAVRLRWDLNPIEEAGLLGAPRLVGPVCEARSWASGGMERRMRLLVDLGDGLDLLMRSEADIRHWLRRPMAGIGGRRPIEAMATCADWIRCLRDAVQDFVP